MVQVEITANDSGQRLDRFLKKFLANAPLSGIYKIIRKDLKVNGKRAKEDSFINEGDILCFYMMDEEFEKLTAKKKPTHAKRQFTVCYEDDDVLVVSKPFGLLVHGDATEKKNTLTNQVIDYLIEKGDYVPRLEKSFTPAPVHRLDRNTTGLVVFGKNAKALRELNSLFAEKSDVQNETLKNDYNGVKKFYKAICLGKIDRSVTLEGYLVKDSRTNKVRVSLKSSPGAKYIKTVVRPQLYNDKYSLVEVELITGRSHQIRAHLASIKHPILGDPKYGQGSAQYLHAAKLILKGNEIKAPLPREFREKAIQLFGEENIDEY